MSRSFRWIWLWQKQKNGLERICTFREVLQRDAVTELATSPFASGATVVVIGLNEESHLASCFESVLASSAPADEIIYVDGGSSDNSVAVARRFPVRIVELSTSRPTPGLGRNEGLARCEGEFVQFVDGDMCLESSWLSEALPAIRNNPSVACVFGRVRERGHSIYSKAIGADWETRAAGPALAPGSGGLFQTSILREVGGYSSGLVAGEESELGLRLRRGGYEILCLDTLMASHDLGLHTFGQYWKRCVRGGRYRAQLLQTGDSNYWRYSTLKPAIFTFVLMAVFLFSILLKTYLLLTASCLLLVLMIIRYALYRYKLIHNLGLSLLVSIENYFRMVPTTVGLIVGLIADTRSSR